MKLFKKKRGVARYSSEISKFVGISNTVENDEEDKNVEKKKTRKELRKDKRQLKKTKKHAFFSKNKVLDKQDEQITVEKKPMKVKKAKKIKTKEDGYVSKVEYIRKKQQLQSIHQDTKEISFWEKRLKINKQNTKKVPKSFIDEGLDYLLDFCDSENRESLKELDLSDADSEFQDDVLEVLRRKEIPSSSDKKRKLSEVKSDESKDATAKNIVKNNVKRVKWADQKETDFLEENDGDNMQILSDSSDSGNKENSNFEIKDNSDSENEANSDSENVGNSDSENEGNSDSENEGNSDSENEGNSGSENEGNSEPEDEKNLVEKSFSESEDNFEDGDDVSKDSDSKKSKKGCWEDIYGRMRDSDGNVMENAQNVGKYVPPAQRILSTDEAVKKERIKKQLKGLLNRLSESNMKPISSQIEDMYMNHSRHDMNETLIQLLIQSCVSPALTPERLVTEHAMLISILHANVGTEVGAFVVQAIADRFNALLSENENHGEGKECDNLLHLLAQIYNFKVIHCTLVCDILKKLGEIFNEKDLDLILMLLKSVGFTLRKDNPTLLKEVISDLQGKAVTLITSEDQSRIRFMLDILMAIKNNNMQKIPNYDPSRIEHLKKMSRSMIRKGSYISELRVSLRDLLDVRERGRWWIVGSAWSGQIDNVEENKKKRKEEIEGNQSVLEESVSEKILDLAYKQRMNTDTRKNIFCIIMTAEDYIDAFTKLLKLGLKNQQEREIIFVCLDCCLQEKKFNPYYSFILEKLCTYERRFQMTMQCAIWDKLKETETLSKTHWSNLAQLVSKLILRKGLCISVLKVIEFSDMNKKLVRFLRQIFLSILLHDSETACQEVFQKVPPSPKFRMFREGLRLFIRHFVLRNKETLTSEDLVNKLEYRCDLADAALLAAEAKVRL
ncbi:Nucleolar MIF4G domain-containing protein 1 [Nymphon striatum]|nr:Nucleolar MIF4G domain-containing protein 1 [Nymphon striatum]